MPSPTLRLLLLAALLVPVIGFASEASFGGLTCKDPLEKVLVGRKVPSGRASAIEAQYKSLGLKALSGFGGKGEPFGLSWWLICGKEHVLLDVDLTVRAVLVSPFPPGSPESSLASCVADSIKIDLAVVFSPSRTTTWPRPIASAWQVDEKNFKFVPVNVSKISCGPL